MSGYFYYKVNGKTYEYYSSDYNWDLNDPVERESLSEFMADHFDFVEEDCPAEWPIHLTVLDKDKQPLATFEIEKQMEPVFHSYEVELEE